MMNDYTMAGDTPPDESSTTTVDIANGYEHKDLTIRDRHISVDHAARDAPSDDDDERYYASGAAKTAAQRKRDLQAHAFRTWIASPEASAAFEKRKAERAARHSKGDAASIHSLLAEQQGGARIVNTPREYQLELFERAKKDNTIAVLDTGSGKTLIAVLLLRWMVDQELASREAGNPARVSFFVVASVNLVYQQCSVLNANLDCKMTRMTGADNTDVLQKKWWTKVLAQNKIIVCTADILANALTMSGVTMAQINLLIFDEAHHAKKNHAYARIMNEHYFQMSGSEPRPRIFGMTASPTDASVDIEYAAIQLEIQLDAKICTTMHASLTDAVRRPEEIIVSYAELPSNVPPSSLMKTLEQTYGENKLIKRLLTQSSKVKKHLGHWCADCYLLSFLSSEKQIRLEGMIGKQHRKARGNSGLAEKDIAVDQLKDAVEFAEKQNSVLNRTVENIDLSSKVQQLRCLLAKRFERPTTDRCIVFVNRKDTAALLCALFKQCALDNLYPGYLIGTSLSDGDRDSMTYKEQVVELLRFRKGQINCLFATSVAEEGLDVADCSMVVRFDLYNSMIQYVQSRGRARKQNSMFVHMVERNNEIQRQRVENVREQERDMRAYCTNLPPERRLGDEMVDDLSERDKDARVYIEPETGAKLTFGNSLSLLAMFTAAIPTRADELQYASYIPSTRGQKFVYEIVLPASAPINSITGQLYSKKMMAKRSAAFEACLRLRELEYLNEYLLPVYVKELPAMRNAHIAVSTKADRTYDLLVKPEFWAQGRGTLPTRLWTTTISFPEGLDRECRSLILLTRQPMPKVAAILLYLENGRMSLVQTSSQSDPITVNEHLLSMLTTFTLRVFSDVHSKIYASEPEAFSYWLAPGRKGYLSVEVSDIGLNCLDMDLLDLVMSKEEYKWTPETANDYLIGRFVIDKWDGSRKFFSTRINRTLKQTDMVPADAAKGKYGPDILNYTVSLYKTARAHHVWSPDQPIIEAELFQPRANMLATLKPREVGRRTKVYLVPEPLQFSVLPPDVAMSCFALPAIIHRLESCLISIEACAKVDVKCESSMALAAMTKNFDGESTTDERSMVVREGMGENYERLEFIGDTFLKTATTISTFIMNPDENEFEQHVRRMVMLCNQNLFQSAIELGLPKYIRLLTFSRRLWYPEGVPLLQGAGMKYLIDGNRFHETQKRMLSDKTIADVCESLIGASFMTNHKADAWHQTMWDEPVATISKLVRSEDHPMTKWSDYAASFIKPAFYTEEPTSAQRALVQAVSTKDAYTFKHARLLYSAFLHPSCPYSLEQVPNYQRLEFLGDALLDQASITWLFNSHPTRDPHWLTKHKEAMVSNKFLGALCVHLGFHKHLRAYDAALLSEVESYVLELADARETAGSDSRDYWTTISRAPKCLPDIVEAYVGAMFIDAGFDFGQVERFFRDHVRWFFEDMKLYDTFAGGHPCTRLHKLMQTGFGCEDYRLMAKVVVVAADRTMSVRGGEGGGEIMDDDEGLHAEPNIVDDVLEAEGEKLALAGGERTEVVAVVMVHGKVVAWNSGSSSRYTKVRAAHEALDELEGLMPVDFRRKYGCDCQVGKEGIALQAGQTHA